MLDGITTGPPPVDTLTGERPLPDLPESNLEWRSREGAFEREAGRFGASTVLDLRHGRGLAESIEK